MTILAMGIGVAAIAAIAVWQFYMFVTFKDLQGGTHHLWWAIGAALIACIAAFLVFSGFLQHDRDDEIHITSQ
ncbi:MAG: hypothetical protein WCB68_11945 [Pyrinomonadaceae bacterium]